VLCHATRWMAPVDHKMNLEMVTFPSCKNGCAQVVCYISAMFMLYVDFRLGIYSAADVFDVADV